MGANGQENCGCGDVYGLFCILDPGLPNFRLVRDRSTAEITKSVARTSAIAGSLVK